MKFTPSYSIISAYLVGLAIMGHASFSTVSASQGMHQAEGAKTTDPMMGNSAEEPLSEVQNPEADKMDQHKMDKGEMSSDDMQKSESISDKESDAMMGSENSEQSGD